VVYGVRNRCHGTMPYLKSAHQWRIYCLTVPSLLHAASAQLQLAAGDSELYWHMQRWLQPAAQQWREQHTAS